MKMIQIVPLYIIEIVSSDWAWASSRMLTKINKKCLFICPDVQNDPNDHKIEQNDQFLLVFLLISPLIGDIFTICLPSVAWGQPLVKHHVYTLHIVKNTQCLHKGLYFP